LTPIDEHSDEDVFIVGYPKSGHTWFQNIIAGLVYGVDPEYCPDSLVQELVPDVHYKRFYKRFGTPTYFKSHALPRPDYRRVVYLLRDGRDAMVSYFHFSRVQTGGAADFRQMVMTGKHAAPYRWHEHVEAWLANPHGARMLVIKYEDLKANTVRELARFCAFVGLDRHASVLEAVAARTTFDQMRAKEVRLGWDDDRWPRGEFFVRRGQVGSHRDEMPADVLRLFLEQSRETLAKHGYL
jgi:hypothetical protein